MKPVRNNLCIFALVATFFTVRSLLATDAQEKFNRLELSDYVTIVVTVPETHADLVREAMGRAGAGRFEEYSYCSFSVKGVGRARPNKGKEKALELEIEERIETICSLDLLDYVLDEIRKAHPHEETIIDIFPIYKTPSKKLF